MLSGTVTRVIDGDTIEVQLSSGPIRVRLNSIDTPEKDQPWGSEAQAALAGRVDGRQVDLEPVTQDHYDRLVAVVFLRGENINAWMVQQGDAWAYRDIPRGSELLRLGGGGSRVEARTLEPASRQSRCSVGVARGRTRQHRRIHGLQQRDRRGLRCRDASAHGNSRAALGGA